MDNPLLGLQKQFLDVSALLLTSIAKQKVKDPKKLNTKPLQAILEVYAKRTPLSTSEQPIPKQIETPTPQARPVSVEPNSILNKDNKPNFKSPEQRIKEISRYIGNKLASFMPKRSGYAEISSSQSEQMSTELPKGSLIKELLNIPPQDNFATVSNEQNISKDNENSPRHTDASLIRDKLNEIQRQGNITTTPLTQNVSNDKAQKMAQEMVKEISEVGSSTFNKVFTEDTKNNAVQKLTQILSGLTEKEFESFNKRRPQLQKDYIQSIAKSSQESQINIGSISADLIKTDIQIKPTVAHRKRRGGWGIKTC